MRLGRPASLLYQPAVRRSRLRLSCELQDMKNLDTLKKDGFLLGEPGGRNTDLDLALVSLRIGLAAFFSTYSAQRHLIDVFERSDVSTADIDESHFADYAEKYAETIVHIQHFMELTCKKLLRDEHVLLGDIESSKAVVLHKLLNGETLSTDEVAGTRSIELSAALKRLLDLAGAGRLKDAKSATPIVTHKNTIETVNELRNRVWHRGLHVLRYKALDELMGAFVLPCILDMTNSPLLSGRSTAWKFPKLHCGLDPLEEIVKAYRDGSGTVRKISFLKEIGRAAYANPFTSTRKKGKIRGLTEIFEEGKRKRAERIAIAEARATASDVGDCPVCGLKSLVTFSDMTGDFDDSAVGETYWYTYRVVCENCTLEMRSDVGNAGGHGLPGISDFWRSARV